MAKPGIVGLPLVLLLLDYWPLQKKKWASAAIEKIPLFALSGVSVLVTLSSIGYSGRLAAARSVAPKGPPAALKTVNLLGQYLPKFFWPEQLSASYITEHLLSAWISCLLVIAISAGALRFRRRLPYLFVGWFWYLAMLAPATGLIVANRFSYLPFIGLSIAVVWGIADLAGNTNRVGRVVASVAAAAVLIGLGVLSFRQVTMWRNSYTIFGQAIAYDPENYVARQWLGDTLSMDGRYREAISQYEEALQEHPYYFLVEVNCARVYLQTGAENDAIRHFSAAIRLRPQVAGPYKELGDILLTQGNVREALLNYKQAQALHYADEQKIDSLVRSLEAALPH